MLCDKNGYFGEYGGRFVPPQLEKVLDEVKEAFEKYREDPEFLAELKNYYQQYVGRPNPLYLAEDLLKGGGARFTSNGKT